MTYARYLALGGFKSFREWSLLEFSPKVSVIVGGNGSGKTSLIEALLWALGEEDPHTLRVDRQSDLLYRRPVEHGTTPIRTEREQHLLFNNPGAHAHAPHADDQAESDQSGPSRETDAAATTGDDSPDVEEAAVYLVLGDESRAHDCGGSASEDDDEGGTACCCVPAGEQHEKVPEGLITISRMLTAQGNETLQVDGVETDRAGVERALRPHGLNRSVVSVVRQGELERILLADPVMRARILAQTAGLPTGPPEVSGNGTDGRRVSPETVAFVRDTLRAWNVDSKAGGGVERVLGALGLPPDGAGRSGQGSELAAAAERVEARASSYFEKLVPDGQLILDLQDADAPGPALHISARFPGGDIENVDTLSGGQRALVAFSVGVAMFQETPSRLMILDEVEPALDERNLRRFNDVLHEIAEDRQVVVVSHQRRTKDVGDVVFGVDITGNGASMLHFRFVPETQQLLVFGRVRGNWLERTAAHERDQTPRGPRSASQPEPKGTSCC